MICVLNWYTRIMAVIRPEVATPRPELTTPRPEVTTPLPEVATPHPEVATPRPEWPLLFLRWPLLVLRWPLLVLRWPLLVLRWPLLVLRWLLLVFFAVAKHGISAFSPTLHERNVDCNETVTDGSKSILLRWHRVWCCHVMSTTTWWSLYGMTG